MSHHEIPLRNLACLSRGGWSLVGWKGLHAADACDVGALYYFDAKVRTSRRNVQTRNLIRTFIQANPGNGDDALLETGLTSLIRGTRSS
eukprot:scaffold189163_cov25-Prasinocladus_malaysianus.AAC.1